MWQQMSKITAVLEQETWVAIDAPHEFQLIVNSFTNTFNSDIAEADVSPNRKLGGVSVAENVANSGLIPRGNEESDASVTSVGHGSPDPRGVSGGEFETENGTRSKQSSQAPSVPGDSSPGEVPVKQKKGREKQSVKTLQIRGTSYHAVNRFVPVHDDDARLKVCCSFQQFSPSSIITFQFNVMLCSGLILLKMVSEYIEITNALPTLVTEVVHRIAEILKHFNSRTCQLVLGAGAMQVRQMHSSQVLQADDSF